MNVVLMRKNSKANDTAEEEDEIRSHSSLNVRVIVKIKWCTVSDNIVKYSVLKNVSFSKILLKIIYD